MNEELLLFRNTVEVYVKRHIGMGTPDWEDVTNEVMLSAIEAFPTFRHESEFTTFLHPIMRRRVADYFRLRYKEKMNYTMMPFVLKDILTPATLYERKEAAELMARLTKDLPPHLARVVQFIDLEGMSGKEAADILKITVKSVYAYHATAREKIRKRLARMGFFDEPEFSTSELCKWINKFLGAYFRLCDKVGTTVEVKVEARKAKEAIEKILKERE